MARSQARPWTTVEAVLAAALAYVVLLVSLTGARIGREPEFVPAPPAAVAVVRVADVRPAAPAARQPTQAQCVTEQTKPTHYAAAPGVVESLAFGPPVAASGSVAAASARGELSRRICYQPDPRLFTALDAAVNRRNPNRPLTREQWAEGTKSFVNRALNPTLVTLTVPAGTRTYGMRVLRKGAAPVVVPTRLRRQETGSYLRLTVPPDAGGEPVLLTLRLRCGFQPVL